MEAIQLDRDGYFVGVVQCDESPLELGAYLLPAGCILGMVPDIPEGSKARWVSGAWAVEQTAKTAEKPWWRKRAAEYPPMSDYLDGVVKGDQAQIDKYIADCLAVKAKYPKPE